MLKRNVLRGNANAIRLARKQGPRLKISRCVLRAADSHTATHHTAFFLSHGWVVSLFDSRYVSANPDNNPSWRRAYLSIRRFRFLSVAGCMRPDMHLFSKKH